MSRYNRVSLLCSALVLLAAMVGCQRKPSWNLAPVEGTVTKDGHPLDSIEVNFLADRDAGTTGPRASCLTDKEGHYRLRTDNGDDGAAVGKYRVVICEPAARRRGRKGTPARGPQALEEAKSPKKQKTGNASRVPLRYERFQETPLRVEVHSGAQVIDFAVKGAGIEVK